MDGIISEKIEGTVENVVYHNDDNDYTVIEVVTNDSKLVTCVGAIPVIFEGERVILRGQWVYHKDFGKQFSFESFEKMLPVDEENILQYLSSSTVKGVGVVTATKIVNKFGVDTFDVLENHPEWLTDIPGITMKKAAIISQSFREQTGIRNVMMYCKNYLNSSEVTKVYKKLGASAVGIIQENPYILCDNSYGISFDKIDKFALDIGFDINNPLRILNGIKYILNYNASANGHTTLPISKLIDAANEVLSIDKDIISKSVSDFLREGKLSSFSADGQDYVMTEEIADMETNIAKRLCEIDRGAVKFDTAEIAAIIDKIELTYSIKYATMQRRAIFEVLLSGVMILTGGPGTGKTTIIKALISIFKSMGLKYVLTAPTGRASKRMSEATSEEAKTIHRMLEMEKVNQSELKFGRNASNPLDENVVIVDEASMIDLSLMDALVRAVRRGGRIILIGDSDQLPSVGAGNVFFDLIESEKIKTVKLSEIFRQAKESMIINNAHRINTGEPPVLNSTDSDFFFVRREDEREIPQTIASLITTRLPRVYGKDIKDKIQVITPSKKGYGGVEVLNLELQSKLNPKLKFTKEKSYAGKLFREGDRVMQTTNNYEIEWEKDGYVGNGVFNGDIGVIDSINDTAEEMIIRFDDRVVHYSFDLLDELELAYAITVHKSQGSEYPVVIVPVYSCPKMLMTRNILYTAVTRARRMVILVGKADIPTKMVQNNRLILRYTTLKYRICTYYD